MFSSFIPIFRLTNRLEILKQNATETREARIHIHDVGLINLVRFNHGDTSLGYLFILLITFNIHCPLYLLNIYILHHPLHWSEIRTESTSILARTRYQTDIGKICCGQNHMKSWEQPNLPGPFQSGFDFTKMIDWELLIDTYFWHILPIFINTFTYSAVGILNSAFYDKIIYSFFLTMPLAPVQLPSSVVFQPQVWLQYIHIGIILFIMKKLSSISQSLDIKL